MPHASQQGPAAGGWPRIRAATENPYPRVLMGSVAHLRQAMLDADHQHTLEELDQGSSEDRAPVRPGASGALAARDRKLPVWWEANTRDEIHRALDLAEEFGTTAVIVGGREAAKVVDRLKAHQVAVVLRLNVPEEPKVPTEEEYRKRPPRSRTIRLSCWPTARREWKEQLATAAVLAQGGVPFAFATDGVDRLESVPATSGPSSPPGSPPTRPWPRSRTRPRPSRASSGGWARSSPASSVTWSPSPRRSRTSRPRSSSCSSTGSSSRSSRPSPEPAKAGRAARRGGGPRGEARPTPGGRTGDLARRSSDSDRSAA